MLSTVVESNNFFEILIEIAGQDILVSDVKLFTGMRCNGNSRESIEVANVDGFSACMMLGLPYEISEEVRMQISHEMKLGSIAIFVLKELKIFIEPFLPEIRTLFMVVKRRACDMRIDDAAASSSANASSKTANVLLTEKIRIAVLTFYSNLSLTAFMNSYNDTPFPTYK